MNRIVFILDTGCDAVHEAGEWFLEHCDYVIFGIEKLSEETIAEAEYLELDPDFDFQKIVEEIEEKYGRLDILILGALHHPLDGAVGTEHDYELFTDVVTENVLVCRNMIQKLYPLLSKGMKRIACITEKESSNSWSEGADNLAYSASLAAINMLGRMMFNKLRPEGFTFRWFCDGEKGGMCAAAYIDSALCYDPKEPYTHSDENRFVMRDAYLREISW